MGGVTSPVVLYEVSRMPDKDRAIEVGLMVVKMHETVPMRDVVRQRANSLEVLGFGGVDALHLACAESGKVDVFLTTDDRLQKRAIRHQAKLGVAVENPLRFFERMVLK